MQHRREIFPFEFTVPSLPGKREQTREAFGDLAERLLTALPGARLIVVSAQLGLSVLAESGDSLDLERVSWSLIDEAVTLLGTGAYLLPRPGMRGSEVEKPWTGKARS